eukprot:201665-Karenia_brevis.AAC.1
MKISFNAAILSMRRGFAVAAAAQDVQVEYGAQENQFQCSNISMRNGVAETAQDVRREPFAHEDQLQCSSLSMR